MLKYYVWPSGQLREWVVTVGLNMSKLDMSWADPTGICFIKPKTTRTTRRRYPGSSPWLGPDSSTGPSDASRPSSASDIRAWAALRGSSNYVLSRLRRGLHRSRVLRSLLLTPHRIRGFLSFLFPSNLAGRQAHACSVCFCFAFSGGTFSDYTNDKPLFLISSEWQTPWRNFCYLHER